MSKNTTQANHMDTPAQEGSVPELGDNSANTSQQNFNTGSLSPFETPIAEEYGKAS
jgi:hypothetical protein